MSLRGLRLLRLLSLLDLNHPRFEGVKILMVGIEVPRAKKQQESHQGRPDSDPNRRPMRPSQCLHRVLETPTLPTKSLRLMGLYPARALFLANARLARHLLCPPA
jgi:hypothetical protein